MRILEISSAKTFGGGERHLVDLSKGLLKNGHEVFAVVRESCLWRESLSFLKAKNIFRLPLKNSLDVFSARKLARVIRENHIEIVHAHLARDYTIASLAVRMAPPAKLVLSRHVLFPLNPAQKFFLKNVSKAIAVSNGVKKELEKTFPPEKISVVYNGIDTKYFGEAARERLGREFRFENNIPFDAPFVGTVGELKPLKGQKDFVLAAQLISQKFPNAHFAIIGQDNSLKKDYRRELKRLVKVFGLEERFLWLDWVEETKSLLRALDIFVSASHSESFGLAILEAMASGTPVVATETEGARELLEAGRLVPFENPVKLAEEVCRLLENSENRLDFGKKLQERAEKTFGLEKMIFGTEAIFREILAER